MPEEYAGFGRFGCIKDCGRFRNTTKIYINMFDFFEQVKSADRWDLSKTAPAQPKIQLQHLERVSGMLFCQSHDWACDLRHMSC